MRALAIKVYFDAWKSPVMEKRWCERQLGGCVRLSLATPAGGAAECGGARPNKTYKAQTRFLLTYRAIPYIHFWPCYKGLVDEVKT